MYWISVCAGFLWRFKKNWACNTFHPSDTYYITKAGIWYANWPPVIVACWCMLGNDHSGSRLMSACVSLLHCQQRTVEGQIHGFAKDCGNSIAFAMDLPQSCAKPLKCGYGVHCRVHTGQEKVRERLFCSRWGKSQGIWEKVREFGKKSGKFVVGFLYQPCIDKNIEKGESRIFLYMYWLSWWFQADTYADTAKPFGLLPDRG